MAVAVMQQSSGAYMTVGIATPRIADIQWYCNFTQSAIPLCGKHSYGRGGTAREHCGGLAIRQAGGRAVITLTYQRIFNLKCFQRAIRRLTAVQPTVCKQSATSSLILIKVKCI
jgi:3-isopropylmalate dehydratase small subunit